MIRSIISTAHYNFEFFSSRKIPSTYKGLISKLDEDDIITTFEKIEVSKEKKISRIYKIPPYFKLLIENKKYRKISVPEIDKGVLIDLREYKSFQDYLKTTIGSRKRKQIRSYFRRIETCLNISYKFYYGEINKDNYLFLLKTAKSLVTKRFKSINKEHYHLNIWQRLEERTLNLILEKKASLFVIYDDDLPINICINYHFNGITANIFTSYDIDYGKFSLGTIDLYKQIEWNFINGFKIFDLMIGESKYKFEWSNSAYNLEHHIIMKKNSFTSIVFGHLISVYLIIKYKIYRFAYTYPNNKLLQIMIPSLIETKPPKEDAKYTIINKPIEYLKNYNLKEININDYNFLKKPFNDFLHSCNLNKSTLKLYKLTNSEEAFIFSSPKSIQKLILKK